MHWLRLVLVLFGLSAPLVFAGDSAIYTFVDNDGEVHLSNVPDDDRYQALTAPEAAAVPRPAALTANASPNESRPYSDVISKVATRFGIDAALLHAVISVESGYNAKAVSNHGAAGLMQLMPETARRYGVVNVFDPAENIRGGAQYLADLLKLFDDDLQLALAAYNAGETAVLKYGKRIPPYPATAAYVPKVVDFYNRIRLLM